MRDRRWFCAVTKLAVAETFLVTADPTDAIKEESASMAELSVLYDREGRTLTVWFSDRH